MTNFVFIYSSVCKWEELYCGLLHHVLETVRLDVMLHRIVSAYTRDIIDWDPWIKIPVLKQNKCFV